MTIDPQTADLRARIVAAIRTAPFKELRTVDYPNGPLQITANVEDLADAVLRAATPAVPSAPADQAAVLRDAADKVFALDYDTMVSEEVEENLGSMREAWDLGTIQAKELLHRLADEAAAVASCPGYETSPSPCRCPCYGCKHHCAAHDPGLMVDEEQQPETRQSCACGQDGCEYCDVDEADEEQPSGEACTCAVAGACFAPSGHYADCPQADQPAVVPQPGKEA